MGPLLLLFGFFAALGIGAMYFGERAEQREHEITVIQMEMDYEKCFRDGPSNPPR